MNYCLQLLVQFRQTDDRQNVMHKSPPCKMGGGLKNWKMNTLQKVTPPPSWESINIIWDMNYFLQLLVQFRQTDDRQKVMHKSPPCKMGGARLIVEIESLSDI